MSASYTEGIRNTATAGADKKKKLTKFDERLNKENSRETSADPRSNTARNLSHSFNKKEPCLESITNIDQRPCNSARDHSHRGQHQFVINNILNKKHRRVSSRYSQSCEEEDEFNDDEMIEL